MTWSAGTRVVILSRVKRNPYVQLLAEGLRQPGLGLQVRVDDRFSLGWVWHQRGSADVLHLHWLELFFTYPSLTRSLKRWCSVMLGLALARLAGMRLVYTLHNLAQHEGRWPCLSRWGHRITFRLAHAVHVHDPGSVETLQRDWGRRRGVYVIPHGNYIDAYPNTLTRQQARERLGLDSAAFVYLSLGRVRPYKGLEELLAAFRNLPDADVVLYVAGEVQEPGYERRLTALAEGDPRVRLQLRFVAEDELQIYLNACDISVLPYRHVTTSGAAMLSFSFGAPILAPRLGCFVDLAGAREERGLLYDAGLRGGLASALVRARRVDLATMRQACMAYARALNWGSLAQQHAAIYRAAQQSD